MLYLSLSLLGQDASPPVVSMDVLNSSTSKFVTSVEFDHVLSSSTLTILNCCCSFISVFIMKRIILTGALLDAVGNTHSIIVFVHMTVSMEVIPLMEVML